MIKMATIVSTGLGTLRDSLREVNKRVRQGFNLSDNTPRMMISSGDAFIFSTMRISEGLSIVIGQINANWGKLKEQGDVKEMRYGLSELRNLKAYFDYIKKYRKLPEPGLIREGKAKYNDEKMMLYVGLMIKKIPVSI